MTSSCVNHSSLHGNLIILHPFIHSSFHGNLIILHPFIHSSFHHYIYILYIHMSFIPSSLYPFILLSLTYILHPFITKLQYSYMYPSSLHIQISFIPSYTHILNMHTSFIPLYTHILHLQISFILASLASCIYLSCNVYCRGKKILSSDFIISLQPDLVDLSYFKPWILLLDKIA